MIVKGGAMLGFGKLHLVITAFIFAPICLASSSRTPSLWTVLRPFLGPYFIRYESYWPGEFTGLAQVAVHIGSITLGLGILAQVYGKEIDFNNATKISIWVISLVIWLASGFLAAIATVG